METKLNRNGFTIFELIVCMAFVFVIMLQILDLTFNIYEKNSKVYTQNRLEYVLHNLYDQIGYDFIKYNIKSVNKNGNTYTFNYYQVNNNIDKTLKFNNNSIEYGTSSNKLYLESDKLITINNVNICRKYDLLLKLTITINEEDYDFIYSNKKIEKIEGIGECS